MGRKKLYASATARKRAQRARESAARAHQLDARPAVEGRGEDLMGMQRC